MNYQEKLQQIYSQVDDSTRTNAEPTSRRLGADVEWAEEAKLTNGTPVRIYYRTTPEDAAAAREWATWDSIPWDDRVIAIAELRSDGTIGPDIVEQSL
jgi:hypothetical protein